MEARTASTRLAGGSNPSRGTSHSISFQSHKKHCPHLLVGLGARILTPETRVRLPLGTLGKQFEKNCFLSLCLGGTELGSTKPGNSVQLGAERPYPCSGGTGRKSPKLAYRVRLPAGVPRCVVATNGSHKADFAGSIPAIATIPRCGSTWLEHRVRDARIAGSNPATSTEGVQQSAARPSASVGLLHRTMYGSVGLPSRGSARDDC